MATQFSNTLQNSSSTAALFRAWVQFLDTTLTAGGWVNTADTGQMTIASAAAPTVANTDVGYRIYRMNDALQATFPIFMRVGYGAGLSAVTPRVNLTFGAGTDGAGNLTSGGFGVNPLVSSGTNATLTCNSYASASTSHFAFLMFVRAGANDVMVCSVERTRDSSGNASGDGLLISYGNAGQLVITNYVLPAAGSQPPAEIGVPFVLSNQSGSSAFNSNVGIGIPLHVKSVVQPAGLGAVAVNSADFAAEATISISLYGVAHTYQLGNRDTAQVATPTGNATFASRATTRVGIRYE